MSTISRLLIVNIIPLWNYIDMGAFNEEQRSTWLFSFGKRAGKVRRFFENIEQGLRAVNAVAFGLSRLLHNSDTLQPLDSSLSGREGNAQLTSYARGSNEWIGSQQINDPQRGVGGLASYTSSGTTT
jgi:hypothetical protein